MRYVDSIGALQQCKGRIFARSGQDSCCPRCRPNEPGCHPKTVATAASFINLCRLHAHRAQGRQDAQMNGQRVEDPDV
jgi:hypothetical protein